jgi:hypothetical protein
LAQNEFVAVGRYNAIKLDPMVQRDLIRGDQD